MAKYDAIYEGRLPASARVNFSIKSCHPGHVHIQSWPNMSFIKYPVNLVNFLKKLIS